MKNTVQEQAKKQAAKKLGETALDSMTAQLGTASVEAIEYAKGLMKKGMSSSDAIAVTSKKFPGTDWEALYQGMKSRSGSAFSGTMQFMKNTVQEQAKQLVEQVKARATGQVKEAAGVPFTPDAAPTSQGGTGRAIELLQWPEGRPDIDDLNSALEPYGVHLLPINADGDVVAVGPASMTQEEADAEFEEFAGSHPLMATDAVTAPNDTEAAVPPDDSEAAQQNATRWVEDRVANREPLLFNEFVRFMVSLGYDKATYNGMKQRMQAEYAKQKQDSSSGVGSIFNRDRA